MRYALILLLTLAGAVQASYSYGYGEATPCFLDCADGCHLLDTCLDDCEYPLVLPEFQLNFKDHQSLYDALYTDLNCAFAETASAWCTCVRSLTSLSLISHLLPPTRP